MDTVRCRAESEAAQLWANGCDGVWRYGLEAARSNQQGLYFAIVEYIANSSRKTVEFFSAPEDDFHQGHLMSHVLVQIDRELGDRKMCRIGGHFAVFCIRTLELHCKAF